MRTETLGGASPGIDQEYPRHTLARLISQPSHETMLAPNTSMKKGTCSVLGTWPVKSSQKRPSGRGSVPPGAVGNCFLHSGIVRPRNRIPSSLSSTDGSQIIPLIPRMPPYAISTVTSPRTFEPCFFLVSLTSSTRAGMISLRVSLSVFVAVALANDLIETSRSIF
jgi:hypothetical protein